MPQLHNTGHETVSELPANTSPHSDELDLCYDNEKGEVTVLQCKLYSFGKHDQYKDPQRDDPPERAAFLMRMLMCTAHAENLIGDLDELYRETWLPKHGKKARRIYWSQAIRSIIANNWGWIRNSALVTWVLGKIG